MSQIFAVSGRAGGTGDGAAASRVYGIVRGYPVGIVVGPAYARDRYLATLAGQQIQSRPSWRWWGKK